MGARPPVTACTLSVVIPVHDEEGNLQPLARRIGESLRDQGDWEVLWVDDASKDGTLDEARAIRRNDPRFRVLHLAVQQGQSAAMIAGIRAARGEWIATLDGDGQNDPADLPRLLAKALMEGADAVVGYRAERHDTWGRRAASRFANRVRDRITGDRVRDTGCGTRVLRREAALSLFPWNGVHRFIPTLLRASGYRVLELPVAHHPRLLGRSKYAYLSRALRGLRDALGVRWLCRRSLRGLRAEEDPRS